jgi:hypothetical protein
VRITTVHPASAPIAGQNVRCEIASGGGSLGSLGGPTQVIVQTQEVRDEGGVLIDAVATCPSWFLGATAGTNTLRAVALNIDDGIIAKEDNGEGGVTSVVLHGVQTFSATATAPPFGFVSVNTPSGASLDNTAFTLYGGLVSFVATIQNPGDAQSNVTLQGFVTQGSTRRAAGGTVLTCVGASQGVLPTGRCVENSGAFASDAEGISGTGTFAAGAATLVLELWQSGVGSGTLLASKSIPITIVIQQIGN